MGKCRTQQISKYHETKTKSQKGKKVRKREENSRNMEAAKPDSPAGGTEAAETPRFWSRQRRQGPAASLARLLEQARKQADRKSWPKEIAQKQPNGDSKTGTATC